MAVDKSSEGDRGARTSVTITASLLQSSATPNSILAIFIDTTARKALEAQFLQAQKMEAIGRLAGGVAHDFNNLLTAILGYTELLRDTLEADDPRRDDVAEIRRAGESATTLTRHLLAFSRKQIAQPTIIDLNDAISQFLKILRRTIGEDVEVALRLDPRVRPHQNGRRAARPDPHEPGRQRARRHDEGRTVVDSNGTCCPARTRARCQTLDSAGLLCHARDRGHGRRHVARCTDASVRAVFHDQGFRQGHGPRPVDRLRHRQAERGVHRRQQRGRVPEPRSRSIFRR